MVNKPLDQMTKEELLGRFRRTAAWRGTYTTQGNVLIRKHIADLNSNAEGSDQVRNFRFDGDILVLSAGGPGEVSAGGRGTAGAARGGAGGAQESGREGRAGGGLEARFKRVKP